MHWYYKAGIAIGLLWGTLRALGVYGEDLRDVDLRFVYGFLATTGSFAGVFLIIDRVAKALGWRRERQDVVGEAAAPAAVASEAALAVPTSTAAAAARRRRTSRPPRRAARR